MTNRRFGWGELYAFHRFLAPLGEEALLGAARAAEAHEGMTLVELACGNAAAGLFLAEEFHLYLRGVEPFHDLLEIAREAAERSPAAGRCRLFHADSVHVEWGLGPFDLALSLRGVFPPPGLVRAGGRVLFGRFVTRRDALPDSLRGAFPSVPQGEGPTPLWRHVATPLEWERFLDPQERALRRYRLSLSREERHSPVAEVAERQIGGYRAHAACLDYELGVFPVGG
ncbi:MAG: SAM-dependent methyltransferase [Planctomycetaceae bacterium]